MTEQSESTLRHSTFDIRYSIFDILRFAFAAVSPHGVGRIIRKLIIFSNRVYRLQPLNPEP
ncbi:hypothetical protein D1AOALGA4SA_12146 [Olavius algarvensis Delta 1 endosymbiont]|nr:hypothetical protein D1AOALGA4SA_12146 [Olavius algarvensis Delta 1 endosymbiont]